MKKILFFVAAIACTMFTSCGNCCNNQSAADTDSVAYDSIDTCVVDSTVLDSTICTD